MASRRADTSEDMTPPQSLGPRPRTRPLAQPGAPPAPPRPAPVRSRLTAPASNRQARHGTRTNRSLNSAPSLPSPIRVRAPPLPPCGQSPIGGEGWPGCAPPLSERLRLWIGWFVSHVGVISPLIGVALSGRSEPIGGSREGQDGAKRSAEPAVGETRGTWLRCQAAAGSEVGAAADVRGVAGSRGGGGRGSPLPEPVGAGWPGAAALTLGAPAQLGSRSGAFPGQGRVRSERGRRGRRALGPPVCAGRCLLRGGRGGPAAAPPAFDAFVRPPGTALAWHRSGRDLNSYFNALIWKENL